VRPEEQQPRRALELGERGRRRTQVLAGFERRRRLSDEGEQIQILAQARGDRGISIHAQRVMQQRDAGCLLPACCQRQRLDFNRGTERDRQVRFRVQGSTLQLPDGQSLGLLGIAFRLRVLLHAERGPAHPRERFEIFGTDPALSLIAAQLRFRCGEVVLRDCPADIIHDSRKRAGADDKHDTQQTKCHALMMNGIRETDKRTKYKGRPFGRPSIRFSPAKVV